MILPLFKQWILWSLLSLSSYILLSVKKDVSKEEEVETEVETGEEVAVVFLHELTKRRVVKPQSEYNDVYRVEFK